MTPGNVEFVDVCCEMIVCTGGVAAILLLDGRRLRGRALERAWLPATRDAAILGAWTFGVLYACPALVVHFVKTRWSPLGALLGVAWAGALFAAVVGAAMAAEAAIDWLGL